MHRRRQGQSAEPRPANVPCHCSPGAEGEGDEEEAKAAQQTEAVLQVEPQLATPTKSQPAAVAAKACCKSPPAKPTRVRSPGDTPSRTEVLRQYAADRMPGVEADAAKWAVKVAVPKEASGLSAAAEFKQEEAARLVRRGPLFGDQNFTL